MKFLPLILKNLFRKKMRAALTLGSFVVALFLFGLLASIQKAFTVGIDIAGVDRLVVINRVSLIQPLPIKYKDQILRLEGVREVTFATWFGGVYQDQKNFFPNFAIDTHTYLDVYSEFVVPDAEWESFRADREGCIVGRYTADRFGWKAGDRIPLQGAIWTGTWEFNISGIYDGREEVADTTQLWFRYDYLEERRPWGKGTVGWYVVRLEDPNRAAEVAAAIDETFANSPWETKAETEQAFNTAFVRQMGNIQLIILVVGSVVFFTLLLVTGSTMSMSVRERTGEFAVMKTLGFSNLSVLLLVFAESLAFALAGGGAGLLAARFAVPVLGGFSRGLFPVFYLPWTDFARGLLLAAAIGILAGAVPAILAGRLKIVDALRRV